MNGKAAIVAALRKFSPLIAAGLIFSLFLPWVEIGFDFGLGNSLGAALGDSPIAIDLDANGWELFEFWDVMIVVSAGVAIATNLSVREIGVAPGGAALANFIAGAIATAAAVKAWIDPLNTLPIGVENEPKIGLFIAFAFGLALIDAAVMQLVFGRDESPLEGTVTYTAPVTETGPTTPEFVDPVTGERSDR